MNLPSETLVAYARDYVCPHCVIEERGLRRVGAVWNLHLVHQVGCPTVEGRN